MTRTYRTGHRARRRTTGWQKFRRAVRRGVRRFLQRNLAKMILIGLPLIGMLAGIFIGVKATTFAQSIRLNDYGRQIAYTSYMVKPGDTLWGIAQDLAALNPEYNDIRQYVNAIERVNKLADGEVMAGQKILIPYFISPSGISDYNDIYDKYGIGR